MNKREGKGSVSKKIDGKGGMQSDGRELQFQIGFSPPNQMRGYEKL